MQNCKQCGKNQWDFGKTDEGRIRATCENCKTVVEWEGKVKIKKEGDKCRKCQTPVEVVPLNVTPKKLKNPFYYSHWLKCPNCQQTYLCEDFKVITGNKTELPGNIKENLDGTLSFI